MLFSDPVRTARSKRYGVLFEVHRTARGADLYIPDPFSWEAFLQLCAPLETDAVIFSLAEKRNRRRHGKSG